MCGEVGLCRCASVEGSEGHVSHFHSEPVVSICDSCSVL